MKQTLKVCLVLLGIVVIISGCSANNKDPNKMGDPEEWKSGKGELKSHLNSGGTRQPSTQSSDILKDDELLNETSYTLPTGEWFVHNGEGKLDYELTSGKMDPGASWHFRLKPDGDSSVDVHRDIRIQLKEVTDGFEEKSSVLDEIIHIESISDKETIMQGRLPSGDGKNYLLSVQIMGTNGLITDTLVSRIQVPAEEIKVQLNLDERQYTKSDDKALLKVYNKGPTRLTLGEAYQIEKYIDDTWKKAPLDLEFENADKVVNPHGHYEQEIPLQALNSGRYRVVKHVCAEGFEEDIILAEEFTIQS